MMIKLWIIHLFKIYILLYKVLQNTIIFNYDLIFYNKNNYV